MPSGFLPSFSITPLAGQTRAILPLFLFLWTVTELFRRKHSSQRPQDFTANPARLALGEFLKLTASLAYHFWQRAKSPSSVYHGVTRDEEYYDERDIDASLESPPIERGGIRWSVNSPIQKYLHLGSPCSTVYILAMAVLYAFCKYLVSTVANVTDSTAWYLTVPGATICTLILLRLFLSRSFTLLQWQAIFLQFCGLFIVRAAFVSSPFRQSSHSIFLSSTLSSSAAVVLSDYVYRRHSAKSFTSFNTILFAFGCIVHLFASVVQYYAGTNLQSTYLEIWSSSTIALTCLEAGRDIAALSVIFHYDAGVEGLMSSASAAVVLWGAAAGSMSLSVGIHAGCFVVFLATATYLSPQAWKHSDAATELQPKGERYRRIISILTFATLTTFLIFSSFRDSSQFGYTGAIVPHISDVVDGNSTSPACQRKPLLSALHYSDRSSYREFENVLLIVFFSHARYDANLDYYKEVYSDFFPNMVFVGPKSREDAGFSHSYDVMLDSYQSDEDLRGQKSWKMAGRMAHHMLYTVMKEHDCYDGYLWAPFDTLLNIPRLQAFNKNYFWYHSPWGEYVHNRALGDFQDNNNRNRHPPPAIISPDPSLDLVGTWQGWGEDWWWGDPNVGLAVCMKAFNRVPAHMRDRMATFTNGTTRLIGGSADTLFIPGRYRERFMDTLALFLETDCFLEIATPTVVHLVVSPEDPILFVDHWWIWDPPFSAEFVRQKWREGYEVDTFHTFHWGDKDANGKWSGDHRHVADVRRLLRESAKRQGIEFP